MGLVAKLTGGKRVNYSTRGSFKRRCYAAGLSHSSGPSWHLSPWKTLHGRSPGKVLKTRLLAREKFRSRKALKYSSEKRKPRTRTNVGYDREYGPLAIEPDMDEEEMNMKKDFLLNTLQEEAANWQELERNTVGQHDNPLWLEKRRNRLTASKFGAVVKRKPHTSCHSLVKAIVYPKELNSKAIVFGRIHEKDAIEAYECKTGNKVEKCGLFCSQEFPYLAASPDGLVGQDGLVEVKCLPSVQEKVEVVLQTKKNKICLEMDEKKTITLKRRHDYYYQIQGQLNITNRKWCDLVVYTPIEVIVERIHVDKTLWEEKMLPLLQRFYKECLLPEIVDSRVVRKLRIRDPTYIVEAQERRKNKTDVTNGTK